MKSNLFVSKEAIAKEIATKLNSIEGLPVVWNQSGSIKYLIIDNFLPESVAYELFMSFPSNDNMTLRQGTQEKKYISAEFPPDSSLVENCLYAFQEQPVIDCISKICQIPDLQGDPELYAGGISSMVEGCFLNPHIDNSHDRFQKKYRRLNLLYYVSADWDSDAEGSLQLWPNGLKGEPITIPSKFNRLVIMATDKKSIHSVSKISRQSESRRLCISNYYFSITSPSNNSYYHSTSFYGFPGEILKNCSLRLSSITRTIIKSLTGDFFGVVLSKGHFRRNKL